MSIGKILISKKYITVEQLAQALRSQRRKKHTKIGALLIELGYITFSILLECLEFQKQFGKPSSISNRIKLNCNKNRNVYKTDNSADGEIRYTIKRKVTIKNELLGILAT